MTLKLISELFLLAVLAVMGAQALKKSVEGIKKGNIKEVIACIMIAFGVGIGYIIKKEGKITSSILLNGTFYSGIIWSMSVNFYDLLWKTAINIMNKIAKKFKDE